MQPEHPSPSDADGLLLQKQHPRSRRHVLLDANRQCAWLYLTDPDMLRIAKDAFAYSPGPLVTFDEAVRAARDGNPPPLSKDYAADNAVIPNATAEHFGFRWSEDGESVAVLHQGDPIAMIVAGKERGYSRALTRHGFYGFPWDSDVYDETFGP